MLIGSLEVECADVGPGVHFVLAEVEAIVAARHFFPDVVIRIERVARLINEAELDRRADVDRPLVRFLLSGDELEQGRFACTIRPDDADNATRRQRESEIFEQQFIAISLGQPLSLDHLATQALGDLNQNLRATRATVSLFFDKLIERADTRLRFGLPSLGRLANPFQLLLDCLLPTFLFAVLLAHALCLGFEPRRIIAFERNAAPAIELEYPADDVIEEVTVMRDEDDIAGIIDEMLFQP